MLGAGAGFLANALSKARTDVPMARAARVAMALPQVTGAPKSLTNVQMGARAALAKVNRRATPFSQKANQKYGPEIVSRNRKNL